MILLQGGLIAQDYPLQFEKLSVEDGLGHNSVNCFLHDSKGFMWIGTFEGLNVYNGYEFKVFTSKDNDSTSLSHNFIECMAEDHYGNIWVGTQNGLNCFNHSNQTFKQYLPDWNNKKALNHNVVKDILIDKNQNMWLAFYGGGIAKYNFDTDDFTQFNESQEESGLKSSFINDLHEDRNGNIWLASWQQGLLMFSPQSGKFEQFKYEVGTEQELGEYNTINVIYEGYNGKLLLGTWGKGVLSFNINNRTFSGLQNQSGDIEKFNSSIVRTISEINNSVFLIGTYQNGLFIVEEDNKNNHKISRFTQNYADSRSLSNNSVWSLYKDRSGLTWIGTWGGGINKLNFDKNQFKTFRSIPFATNWLKHSMITSIVELENGKKYIATFNGGFYFFDEIKNEFIDLIKRYNLTLDDKINCLKIDKQNNILIGTQVGLFFYNTTTNTIEKFISDQKGEKLSSEEVSSLFVDNKNSIWIGTWNAGLNKLKIAEGKLNLKKYYHIENDSSSISSNTIINVYQDRFGVLWIGTAEGGLSKYNYKTDNFERVYLLSKSKGSIRNISVLFEDSKGEFWVGSYSDGLINYNRKTGESRHWTTAEGLPNNAIYSILEDELNNLWLGTGFGLSVFKKGSNKFKNYYAKDGLHGNIFNSRIYGPHLKSKSGDFIFGGENGFTVFNPLLVKESSYQPELVLTKLYINGEESSLGDTLESGFVIDKPVYKLQKIKLNHREKFISFEFAALHYTTPENIQYAYMLEGFDKDWIVTSSSRRFANYTNLSPGKYILKVKATNCDGVWNNDEILKLNVHVYPPYWETWWFRTAIVFLLVFGAYYFYHHQMKIKNFQLSVEEKLREAEKIISEKQIIKLQNEQFGNEIETKDKELANNNLHLEQKNERLKVIKDYLNEIIPHASEKVSKQLASLKNIINEDIRKESNWDSFEKSFDVLHDNFIKRFTSQFPKVTHKDMRIVGYIRQNYSNKEIAEMQNISLRSLESSRYRLRKKMDLPSDVNLNDFIIRF